MKKGIHFFITFIMLFLLYACSGAKSNIRYLNNFGPIQANTPYVLDKDPDGGVIRLKGTQYKKGICMVAGLGIDSTVKFELKDSYDKFNAVVGIGDPHSDYPGELTFEVYSNEKKIYSSNALSVGELEKMKFSIKGIKKLTLKVTSTSEAITDFAVWADVYLSK